MKHTILGAARASLLIAASGAAQAALNDRGGVVVRQRSVGAGRVGAAVTLRLR